MVNLKRLEDNHLIFEPISEEIFTAYLQEPFHKKWGDVFRYGSIIYTNSHEGTLEKPAYLGELQTHWRIVWDRRNKKWIADSSQSHPVPSPDEVYFIMDDFEKLIDYIITYYTENNLTINEWIIPLHRHPEFTEQGLRHILEQIQPMNSKEFEQKMEAYSNEFFRNYYSRKGSDIWEGIYRLQFVEVKSLYSDRKLMIRRDMKEAVIVV